MNPILCIYHQNCLDGFGAAYALWRKHPQAQFVPAHYGDTPPDVTGADVYIVDFSYPPETLVELANRAHQVTVIDHHRSAVETINAYPAHLIPPNLCLLLDESKSGAVLTWEYLHPTDPIPQLLEHIQDRDPWQFRLPDTREITAALASLPMDFDTWNTYGPEDEADSYGAHLMHLTSDGAAILRYQNQQIDTLLAKPSQRITIGGFNVPCLNAPGFLASEIGNRLSAGEPFSAIYFDLPDKRVYSLRSQKDGGENVARIAQLYGGGGHPNAAGFTTQLPAHRVLV